MNKITTISIGAALLLALGGTAIIAQDSNERGGRGHGAPFDFAAVDADGNGEITGDELTAFRAAKFAEVDTDGSGTLDEAELQAAAEARDAERMANRTARMLARADTNEDGVLSQDEMEATQRGGDMIERLDADNNGSVSQAEMDAAREQRAERHGERGEHGGRGGHSPRG